MLATACSGDSDSGPTTTQPGAVNTPTDGNPDAGGGARPVSESSSSSGSVQLGLRLSEGTAAASATELLNVAEGELLTNAEVAAVLDRLPEWDVPDTDVAEFNRPVDSLQPPVVGDTIDAPFPPAPIAPSAPDVVAEGPLEVLRFQPEGNVEIAPFIALTFNEPMVALATLDQLDDADVPVVVTPDIGDTAGIDGRWRWIGTRTLRFEVTPTSGDDSVGNDVLDRLPAATDYTVTVPVGTESANGAVLENEVSFTFSTPSAAVTQLWGLGDSMGRDPVFVATFDQRVDAGAIVDVISLEAGDVSGVRIATTDEVAADQSAQRVIDQELEGRAVAFVATQTLPTDSPVSIDIGPGVASLEGPLINSDTFSDSGRTYAPLQLTDADCFDGCRPFTPFSFRFNNQLDLTAFDTTWINVDPAVPGLRVDTFESSLSISGATTGNTTYTVTIDGALVDIYGQALGDDIEEEFDVGDARPLFVGPDRQFVTTDPFAETPGLSYTTINHDQLSVTAWQVAPSQYTEYLEYLDTTYSDTLPTDPDWPVVLSTTVDIDGGRGQLTETIVDLTAAFDESAGPIVLRVHPDPLPSSQTDEWWQNRPVYTWVQSTTLGVDAFATDSELLVWVTDLLTGEPVGAASITTLGAGSSIVTADDGGVARIPLTSTPITGLDVTAGDRSISLPSQGFNGWVENGLFENDRWYVIDDRGIYRPGETVRITGLIRDVIAEDGQLAAVPPGSVVTFRANDPQGNELVTGTADLNAVGGFNFSIELPEGANTGFAWIDIGLASGSDVGNINSSFGHQFQIQDFRTPEYEVIARSESPAPYYVVEPATVAVDAEYFAGGPLADSEVNWVVSTTDTSYNPPGWSDFSFGVWTPWWYAVDDFGRGFEEDSFSEPCFDCFPGGDQRFQEFTGRTNAAGTHLLQIDFADTPTSGVDSDDPNAEQSLVDQPTNVVAEATVFDINRQAISTRTNLLVHPARYYVGLRSDRGFVEKGQPIIIDTTVVDVDGVATAGRTFDVTAGRLDDTFNGGRYVQELVDVQTCTITSTDGVTNDVIDEAMRCEFNAEVGGQYEITAIVTDGEGRSNRAVYTQWVSGGTSRPTRDLTQGEVVIVPDAEFHAPGDTAELLVQAPFAPASGLVIVTRAGVESVEVFDAPDGSAIISVPISDDDIPNLNVRVDMVGANERLADDGTPLPDAPQQPAFAVGQIRIEIPPVTRTLEVVATPASSQLQPGESTSVEVSVTDANGDPVSDAGVALIVVDEAVLSLSNYELADPIDTFYQSVFSQLDPSLIRDSIILANPDLFAGSDGVQPDSVEEEAMESAPELSAEDLDVASSEPAGDRAIAAGGGAVTTPIDVRVNFDALAVFAPDETTNASGIVTVDLDLPDNLTRYRVMAVAASDVDRFGSGESMITARLPVSVRPSAPRFLNFGDRFELPIVIQNQTDAAVDVDIAIETANLTLIDGVDRGAGRSVTVPANDRIEVRFPAAAAEVGTARFRVATVSGDFTDAATIELPVHTPATSEAFATYGVLDGDAAIAQPLVTPDGVFPQFGGLEISTSSTALQALTDAVLYLYDYRYDSADGYASRIMAVAALRDVLDAFDADGLPEAAELDAAVQRDIAALQALQNDDGGFPYWQRGRQSIPWVSVQSTHAQVLAQQNGYDVDQFALEMSLAHVRSIEDFIPATYGQPAKDALSAYALYVRNLAGDADPSKALTLYRRGVGTSLQLDSIAQLWPVISDTAAREEISLLIENAAVETAGAATFATSYGEDAYLIAHSDRRTDGVVLGALVSETPVSDLIPKVVTALLGNQTRGRWNNAQENSFILLALNDYFDTFESVDPDFVARAWLGETYAAEAEFRGRSTDTSLTTVPMADLIAAGDVDLIVDKGGAGRLYYRFGLRYAPDDLDLDPRDEGFVVERTYEAVDDPADVQRNTDGSWEIAAGATVRVRLTMVADAQRTHVALIDPLPAGLEPVNPTLATSITVPGNDSSLEQSGWWYWQWFNHQNLRDDRAEAFATYLPGGTYEYTYVARATTLGEFVVPPTRAEEIFAPEVFGRSASDIVTVK
jgi:uncharacterized protein YfaS (alpha-2-macroglobulin family)